MRECSVCDREELPLKMFRGEVYCLDCLYNCLLDFHRNDLLEFYIDFSPYVQEIK